MCVKKSNQNKQDRFWMLILSRGQSGDRHDWKRWKLILEKSERKASFNRPGHTRESSKSDNSGGADLNAWLQRRMFPSAFGTVVFYVVKGFSASELKTRGPATSVISQRPVTLPSEHPPILYYISSTRHQRISNPISHKLAQTEANTKMGLRVYSSAETKV